MQRVTRMLRNAQRKFLAPAGKPLAPASKTAISRRNPRVAAPPSRDRRTRILIIEDELPVALLIEETIREVGYRVAGIAHSVTMARQEFAKRHFDAVIMDINLDGRSNPELADVLLARAVPFAFVTGYDYVVEPRHEKVPLLQKPFAPAELCALLQKLAERASLGAEMAQSA